jgi:hypothetical protein
MFIDEKTGIIIHADLNTTVIRATLRPQDLVHEFLDVIKDTPEYLQIMMNPLSIITDPSADDDDERWDSEDMSYFLNEVLWDVLNMYAPEGYYFGCTEGDGSDFGYWKFEEEDV